MGCSLKVLINYLMGLDNTSDYSEVNHGQVDLNANFPGKCDLEASAE